MVLRPVADRAAEAVLFASCALLVALAACGRATPGGDAAPRTPAPAAHRIVSLSPNLSELLFALGVGDRVVGVDDYTLLPEGTREVARLGGFVDPDRERLIALHPDLVVLIESQAALGEEIERLGIAVLRVDNQDLADVEASVRAIADRVGVPERGEKLAARLHRELAPRPVARGRRVAVAVGTTPGRLGEVLVAGPGCFHGELLRRLGAENVFADLATPYAAVSAEEVLARRPDALLDLQAGEPSPAARAELVRSWQRLLGPGARVAIVAGEDVLIPGPGLPELYRRMAAALARDETSAPVGAGPVASADGARR